MRRILTTGLLALSALGATPAIADEDRPPLPLRQEAARMLDAAKLFAADTSFRAGPIAASRGYRFPDDFPPEAARAIGEAEAKVRERADGPFRETMIDIYASRMTLEQLAAAANFLATPAGQARVAMIQRQAVTPDLSWSRVFAQDKPLRAAVRDAAKQRGLALPE